MAAVMNDAEFLYLCVYPQDNSFSQKILRQGLTVWLNADEKSDKNLGIRFPLPKHPVEVRENLIKGDKADQNSLDDMLAEVEIFGAGNKPDMSAEEFWLKINLAEI